MRSSGAMLFSSAATSSCAIALSSASCVFVRQVLEDGRGVLARQHAEDDDLVFDVRSVSTAARSPACRLRTMSRSREKSRCAHHRGKLVGGPRDLADRAERLVALRAVELLFHLRERRSDDVVVVHVRADGLDGVEPHAMDQIEIARRERRRVRAEVIRVVAPAVVVDDQPDVERLGPRRAPTRRRAGAPGRRPTVARIRRRGLRAAQRTMVATSASNTLRGHDQQVHRAAVALRERHHLREQPPLGRRRRRMAGGVVVDVDAEQPRGHHDHVAIASLLQRRRDVRERVGMAHGDEQVAGPSLDLAERQLGRRQQLERVDVVGLRRAPRPGLSASTSTRRRRARRSRSRDDHRRESARSAADAARPTRTRPAATRSAAQPDIERHAVGARAGHARPQAHERREPDEQRQPDAEAYACASHGTRPPLARMIRTVAAAARSGAYA